MLDALGKLGVEVTLNADRTTAQVIGLGGAPRTKTPLDLFVANSGTSIRFLTAFCAAGQGEFRLDGIERMRERPIRDLLAGLEQLGATLDGADRLPTGDHPREGTARWSGNHRRQHFQPILKRAVDGSPFGPIASRIDGQGRTRLEALYRNDLGRHA